MKRLIIGAFIVASVGMMLSACAMEETAMPADQSKLQIRTGVYRGECFGYCREEMTVTRSRLVHKKVAYPPDVTQPDIVKEQAIKVAEWNALVKNLDLDAFWRLPRMIGEPDAADQGGEWVEITRGDKTKRVDFEAEARIPEIEMFLERLRKLRRDISQ